MELTITVIIKVVIIKVYITQQWVTDSLMTIAFQWAIMVSKKHLFE